MFKRFCSLIIACILTGNCSAYSSSDVEQELIDEVIFSVAPYIDEGNNNISRAECVATIMKIIGADEQINKKYRDADYYAPVFTDVNCIFYNNCGYIYIAKFYGVAKGIIERYPWEPRFEPDRAVTVKETLAFMLRCLTDSKLLQWEDTVKDSVKYGLIESDELEKYNFEEPIQNGQFYILLCRMLNSERYLYWSKEGCEVIDSKNGGTYLQYLSGDR